MSKRTIDLSWLSTSEIQQIRNDEIAKKKRKTCKDKVDLQEIKPMTVNAMRDFILNSTSTTDMLTKHLRIQSFQKVGDEELVLFELHGYAKFNERTMMKNLLDRTIGRVGAGFMAKLVKYAAEFCIDQYRLLHCKPWFNLLKLRADYDWPAVFLQCTKAFPEMELPLLVTMITLIPDQQPKYIPRIYALMALNDDIPNCYVWLSKIMMKNYGTTPPDKKDIEICTRRYLNKVYDHVKPMLAKSTVVNVLTEAQRKFALISEELLSAALKIVNEKNIDTMKSLILDPRCDIAETPCPLFIEYFVQFVKLGVFNFSNADKLIAWNYYYDDRWMGYDRPDLFGTDFELYDQFIYTESFKHRKNMSMEHPHMIELTLATRAYDWMAKDRELYDTLMEKYADEDMIQYFAISLTFCGFFDHMIGLFENYKDKMKTNEGFMCLHMGYLFACIKKPGMLKEAMITWATIVKHAIKWKYLACIAFNPKTFPIPAFVRVKFAGQFATRMMRNCLWETAKAEGVNGWKKYGLLILLFCESLEDSFLNHQMVRVLFQKIEVDNWTFVLRPGFERCIRRGETFNHIMTNVYIENEEMVQELRKQNFLPTMKDFPKTVPTPGYLRIFHMLQEKDDIFAEMHDWIPEEILANEVVEEVEEIAEEPADKTEKEDPKEKNSSNDSSDFSAETPDDSFSPAPAKQGGMSKEASLMETEDDGSRQKSVHIEEEANDLSLNSGEPKAEEMELQESGQQEVKQEAMELQEDAKIQREKPVELEAVEEVVSKEVESQEAVDGENQAVQQEKTSEPQDVEMQDAVSEEAESQEVQQAKTSEPQDVEMQEAVEQSAAQPDNTATLAEVKQEMTDPQEKPEGVELQEAVEQPVAQLDNTTIVGEEKSETTTPQEQPEGVKQQEAVERPAVQLDAATLGEEKQEMTTQEEPEGVELQEAVLDKAKPPAADPEDVEVNPLETKAEEVEPTSSEDAEPVLEKLDEPEEPNGSDEEPPVLEKESTCE